MPQVTLAAQKRRPERVNIHVDGSYWRAASFDSVMNCGISAGQVSDDELERLGELLDGRDALDRCIRAISYRMRSRKELVERMGAAGDSDAAQAYALRRLEELEMLDDAAVASAVVETWIARKRGPRSALGRLRDLGIDRELAECTIEERYGAVSLTDLAAAFLSRVPGELSLAEHQRSMGRLLRAGYDYGVAGEVLGSAPRERQQQAARSMDDQQVSDALIRRFPGFATDSAVKRRAQQWFMRRGVSWEQLRRVAAQLSES